MNPTDRELVERAASGDAGAVAALFSRYWRAARGAAYAVTRDVARAEDAAAEGFRQALDGLATVRDADRFGAWLRTIVVRQARASRTPGRLEEALADEMPGATPSPDEILERLERDALARALVGGLPLHLREAVVLVYFEGYDTDDAARFLDVPAGTLRRRLYQARKRLRVDAGRVLEGRERMTVDRNQRTEDLRRQIERAADTDDASLFAAFRGTLALRPVPCELIGAACRRLADRSAETADSTCGTGPIDPDVVRRLLVPSTAATEPNHPIAAVAGAIRAALPEFEDWRPDVATAATRWLAGGQSAHHPAPLPPGFADGRVAASIRQARGLLLPDGATGWRVTYESIDDAADPGALREGLRAARLCDTLELSWTAPAGLELRAVQALLERIAHAVVPDATVRFAPHDEPRYRAAFRMFIGDVTTPAADGGVLASWPGRPDDLDGAHIRVFLETWLEP